MDKLRYRQEVQAYRIVRRNVLKIVNAIPFNNMAKLTFQSLIYSNVTETQIKEMYKELKRLRKEEKSTWEKQE